MKNFDIFIIYKLRESHRFNCQQGDHDNKNRLRGESFWMKTRMKKGKEITKEQMDSLNIQGDDCHLQWNYTIASQLQSSCSSCF